MPNSRSINIRELERASGNCETALSHINQVLLSFAEGAEKHSQLGNEVPQEYTDIAEQLDGFMTGLDIISKGLIALSETI